MKTNDRTGELEYEMEWEARATYTDGTEIDRLFPYYEKNYREEEKRQHELEWWLIEKAEEHGGCEFYTVNVVYK